MTAVGSGLVEIVREFLVAHRLLRQVAARYRGGLLAFEEVGELVGDDERSVLFRLKERTHALFRGEGAIGPAALFDLAVGSLFHEAMKFRENFYQRSAYGPKVQALREAAVRDASGLLPEFEKLLEGAALRIDESLQELDTLLAQTTAQFRVLLEANAHEGVLARVLVARGGELAEVFGGTPDELFAALYGDVASAWSRAGRSLLESGFYEEAVHALERAGRGGADGASLEAYARGMRAYLAADYEEAALELIAWLDGSADPLPDTERGLAGAASAALARVGALAGAESDAAAKAELALDRLRAQLPG
jgi:tetratricopeptide (TPR) repeat protein